MKNLFPLIMLLFSLNLFAAPENTEKHGEKIKVELNKDYVNELIISQEGNFLSASQNVSENGIYGNKNLDSVLNDTTFRYD